MTPGPSGTEPRANRAAGIAAWSWDEVSGRLEWAPGASAALGIDEEALPASFRRFLRGVAASDRGGLLRAVLRHRPRSGPLRRRFGWGPPGRAAQLVQGRGDRDAEEPGRWYGTLQLEPAPDPAPPRDAGAELDATTGIATLSGFREHVRRAVARSRRRGDILAVVLLDLNRFGRINEQYGHEAGDQVLREVASRLVGAVREDDVVGMVSPPGSKGRRVSRVGGDKFVLMLERLESARMAATVAKRILDRVEVPIRVGQDNLSVSARAGISLFPVDGLDAMELLMHAEAAIQRTRLDEGGDGAIKFFSQSAALRHQREIELEGRLKEAIESGSFRLAYQPKVSVTDGRPVGFEALLRYEDPDTGPVSAQKVIELAERTGLIHGLGQAIFRRVCLASSRLRQETGVEGVRIFTNFSPKQLRSPEWKPEILRVLEETGTDPALVGVEITESLFVEDRPSLVNALNELSEYGVEISLDDFGTGYSSLSYLTRLPLHELKIDRSFVNGLASEAPGSREVAGLLIILGRTLGLRVVAEGIETEEQAKLLRGIGCRIMQGYYYSRPRALAHFTQSVRDGHLEPAGTVADDAAPM